MFTAGLKQKQTSMAIFQAKKKKESPILPTMWDVIGRQPLCRLQSSVEKRTSVSVCRVQ
jgi:hypothetical protein